MLGSPDPGVSKNDPEEKEGLVGASTLQSDSSKCKDDSTYMIP
jgi:hypothetical protein